MEQPDKKQCQKIVLRYDKRRYDGGAEVSLIQYLQEKQANRSQDTLEAVCDGVIPTLTEPKKVESEEKVLEKKHNKLLQAVIGGPIEFAIGCVGIMTAFLALYTFRTLKNDKMSSQSKDVLKESAAMACKGVRNTLLIPVKVLKVKLAELNI